MQFQQDWPKDKKLQLFQFFGGKLRNFSLDGALWCGSRGIDNFSLSQPFGQYVNRKLSIRRFLMWNFTRIRHKKKKLWLSIIPARRQWPATIHKKCELPLIFASIRQAVRRWKAVNLGSLNLHFQQDLPKDKKLQLFKFFTRKLRKISLDWALWCASRGIKSTGGRCKAPVLCT